MIEFEVYENIILSQYDNMKSVVSIKIINTSDDSNYRSMSLGRSVIFTLIG